MKRILALFLVFVILLSGCGKKESDREKYAIEANSLSEIEEYILEKYNTKIYLFDCEGEDLCELWFKNKKDDIPKDIEDEIVNTVLYSIKKGELKIGHGYMLDELESVKEQIRKDFGVKDFDITITKENYFDLTFYDEEPSSEILTEIYAYIYSVGGHGDIYELNFNQRHVAEESKTPEPKTPAKTVKAELSDGLVPRFDIKSLNIDIPKGAKVYKSSLSNFDNDPNEELYNAPHCQDSFLAFLS